MMNPDLLKYTTYRGFRFYQSPVEADTFLIYFPNMALYAIGLSLKHAQERVDDYLTRHPETESSE